LTFLIISSLLSCKEEAKQFNDEKASHYEQLILNVALSNPDYKCHNCWSKESYDSIKELILNKEREISDDDLGLNMALHKWTYDGGQSFPKAIIYLSNNKGFEYAFPFYDEYYYWRIYPNKLKNSKLKREFKHRMSFENQLNFVINRLELNKPDKKEELNQFITLLADSLLAMKEFSFNDTLELKKYVDKNLDDTTRITESCAKNVEQNINNIIDKMSEENIRIFSCYEGFNGFWKFETTTDNKGNLRIKPTFENKECYFSVYF
jgi:hypothetical protein